MPMPTEEQLDLLFEEIVSCYLRDLNKSLHETYSKKTKYHSKFYYVTDLAASLGYEIDKSNFKVH